MTSEQLIVFVKAPRPGWVKTRLARSIGDQQACEAYRELAETVLRKVSSLKEVELRFSPDDSQAEIEPWLQPGWNAVRQGEGDLGARLDRTVEEAFARGAKRVVIIGSDCPDVEAADIRSAFRELKSFDVVVGPATDGGYWLIGLSAPRPELFRQMEWSSDEVLGETLRRAKAARLRIQLLRILSDVDTVEDWKRWSSSRD